jgi:hypothetical protein
LSEYWSVSSMISSERISSMISAQNAINRSEEQVGNRQRRRTLKRRSEHPDSAPRFSRRLADEEEVRAAGLAGVRDNQ